MDSNHVTRTIRQLSDLPASGGGDQSTRRLPLLTCLGRDGWPAATLGFLLRAPSQSDLQPPASVHLAVAPVSCWVIYELCSRLNDAVQELLGEVAGHGGDGDAGFEPGLGRNGPGAPAAEHGAAW